MIGDLILWINRVWKQETCVHNYKFDFDRTGLGKFDHHECTKCGKYKF